MTSQASPVTPLNLAQKLISDHLVSGDMLPGSEIALRIDQALLQDVLGTLVMLELEAMGIDRVHTQPSVQYIDHGLVQADNLNAETYLFLKSACERFGVWYSGPGNGISHPVHMENFGVPGQSLVGCDSHTTSAGALGMLAIGAGGIEVAMAMAGEPLYITMPRIWGVRLEGRLPDWVSAKDVVLELLRRHGVSGGKNSILEFYGPGLDELSAMDRLVIANMGTEMGATTSVFPSDESTRRFMSARGREGDWQPLAADPGCHYDVEEVIDLSMLVPLIALPSSPDKVVPVSEVVGQPLHQAYIGSSGNPGYRDFAIVSSMVKGRSVADGISLDINPSSRQVLSTLIQEGYLGELVASGARLHQAGCNGCIGMGQAPAVGRNSLRTVPRSMQMDYPRINEPEAIVVNRDVFAAPLPIDQARLKPLQKTDNTPALPTLRPLPNRLEIPVLLITGDNISTDDIMPAGQRVMPYWSSIYASAPFTFEAVDAEYARRADASRNLGGHIIVGGHNYGQGSSRENAALVPRYLGLQVVIAKSFARIHWQNLICFGALPLTFIEDSDADKFAQGDTIIIENLHAQVATSPTLEAEVAGKGTLRLHHGVSERQRELLRVGGVINHLKARQV